MVTGEQRVVRWTIQWWGTFRQCGGDQLTVVVERKAACLVPGAGLLSNWFTDYLIHLLLLPVLLNLISIITPPDHRNHHHRHLVPEGLHL